jgi:hypothetical protein
MTGTLNDLGTHTWVERTGGLLTAAERRSLLRPLVGAHVNNAVGRLSMLLRVNTGRRALVPAARLRPPDSVLTRTAEAQARRRLTLRTEAARAPRGRVAFLRRYGAFDLAIKTAPFRG